MKKMYPKADVPKSSSKSLPNRPLKLNGRETTALVLLAQNPSQEVRQKLKSALSGRALRIAKLLTNEKADRSTLHRERLVSKTFRERAESLKLFSGRVTPLPKR